MNAATPTTPSGAPNGTGIILGTSDNVIGGTTPGAGNVVARNNFDGISITPLGGGRHRPETRCYGNFIGTIPSGYPLGNRRYGVVLWYGSTTIGGTAPGSRNVISSNESGGIHVRSGTASTTIQGNYVGLAPDGLSSISGANVGIWVEGAPGAVIGGTDPAARNVISGNRHANISVSGAGASDAVIQGNYIGPDATGNAIAANSWNVNVHGIQVSRHPEPPHRRHHRGRAT